MEHNKVKISTGLRNLLKKSHIKTSAKFQDQFLANPDNRNSYLSLFDNALVVEIASNDY